MLSKRLLLVTAFISSVSVCAASAPKPDPVATLRTAAFQSGIAAGEYMGTLSGHTDNNLNCQVELAGLRSLSAGEDIISVYVKIFDEDNALKSEAAINIDTQDKNMSSKIHDEKIEVKQTDQNTRMASLDVESDLFSASFPYMATQDIHKSLEVDISSGPIQTVSLKIDKTQSRCVLTK